MRAFGLAKVIGFYAALFGVAVGAMLWRDGLGAALPGDPLGWAVGVGAGTGSALFVVLVSRLLVRHFSWAARLHTELESIFGELSRRQAMILAASSGLA